MSGDGALLEPRSVLRIGRRGSALHVPRVAVVDGAVRIYTRCGIDPLAAAADGQETLW